jgi:endonuclease/exonuclease/phosphatase family metal-dependent hydrolase
MISKNKAAFLLIAVLLVGWLCIRDSFQISSNPADDSKVNKASIMSYNVRIFDNFKWSGEDNSGERMLDFIAGEQPDIICLQEFMVKRMGEFGTRNIRNKLDFAPYVHTKYMNEGVLSKVGLAMFSKYPIINKGGKSLSDKGPSYIYSDILINSDTIRFFNIHLESNRFDQNQINLIDSLISGNPGDKKSEYIGIIKNMKAAYIKRSVQAEIIRETVKSSPYPVVITGDFNDTPVSYAYHTISEELHDAFVKSGGGLGASYREFILPLRIDYILHDPQIKSSGFKTHNLRLSDHRPIQAQLYFGGLKGQGR